MNHERRFDAILKTFKGNAKIYDPNTRIEL